MLLTLADKKSRFRQLAKQLKRVTPLLLLAFLPTLSFAQKAETEHLLKNTIPAEQAEPWGRMQIQCPTGRIEPVDTYTDKLLRKIYRSDTFEGLSSEQVIIGFLMNPSYW